MKTKMIFVIVGLLGCLSIGNLNAQPIGDVEGDVTQILFPDGGAYYQSSSFIPGAIKIKLPVLYTNTMLKIWIDVFNYRTNESISVIASGYNYAGNGGYWTQCTGQIFTTSKEQAHNIYFGDDDVNTIIWIGEPNSSWRYLAVRITKIQASHLNDDVATWDDGWEVSPDNSNFKTTPGLVTVSNTLPYSYWQPNGVDNIHYSEGGVGIGTNGVDNVPLTVLSQTLTGESTLSGLKLTRESATTSNVYSVDRGIESYFVKYDIPAGISDTGWKIGLDGSAYARNSDFAGTLKYNCGLWAKSGIYFSSASGVVDNAYGVRADIYSRSGTIDKAYGVYISSNSLPLGTINKHYDLYASTATANNYFAGNVGLGKLNPSERLHVVGNMYSEVVNAGVVQPQLILENQGGLNGGSRIDFVQSTNQNRGSSIVSQRTSASNFDSNLSFFTDTGNGSGRAERMRITSEGNVNIGTTELYPDYRLSVAGKGRFTEVKVQPEIEWMDIVFEEDYDLRSLEEVKKYIDENGHLPDIPSAEEVEKNGFNLGEMDANLLRKIEELTLYLIEKEEKIDQIMQVNEDLLSRMERIEQKLKN